MMTSVQRSFQIMDLESEAPFYTENDRNNWPMEGALEFQDVVMKYRPTLKPSLKGVTFKIEGQGRRLDVSDVQV